MKHLTRLSYFAHFATLETGVHRCSTESPLRDISQDSREDIFDAVRVILNKVPG